MDTKVLRRQKLRFRIRKTIKGTADRPRLSVFRSNKDIYAQLIDDVTGVTLAATGVALFATALVALVAVGAAGIGVFAAGLAAFIAQLPELGIGIGNAISKRIYFTLQVPARI